MTPNAIVRNTGLVPLSMQQLHKAAPSVFAEAPRGDVSDRYGHVPTYRIIENLHRAGLVPVELRTFAKKDEEKRQFAKHMLRFRPEGDVSRIIVGDIVPQVVMVNSHDRSSRFELYGGMYRLVCENGMLVSEGDTVEPIVIRHTVNMVQDILERSAEIIMRTRAAFEYVALMRRIKLNEKHMLNFSRAALTLRADRPGIIQPEALLRPRRTADTGNDLWSVYNRVQENMIKGGVEGRTANGRRVVTMEARAIGTDMRINGGLWNLAMRVVKKVNPETVEV